MKNTLRVTIVLLLLGIGSTARPQQSEFDGPGGPPCPVSTCEPG
jgi:hypothetical protein